jgi:hydrogenase nickel incorporation protein HypA/HybF
MHEMSIAQNILDIVKEEMARHQVAELAGINITVGKLSAIVPSSLRFCFNILTDKTDLAGAELHIRVIPIGYACLDCGARFESEEMTFVCPHCEAENPMITSGRDMTIESLEVADPEPEPVNR